jgi:hypothetical protein
VRVENHDGVVVVPFEDVLPELVQARDEGDLLAVVELEPLLLREHDGGHMGEEAGPDDLTHGSAIPSAR